MSRGLQAFSELTCGQVSVHTVDRQRKHLICEIRDLPPGIAVYQRPQTERREPGAMGAVGILNTAYELFSAASLCGGTHAIAVGLPESNIRMRYEIAHERYRTCDVGYSRRCLVTSARRTEDRLVEFEYVDELALT